MRERMSLLEKRGAATIEAILALSVFIIVWVGVLYMGRVYNAKLELKSKTRACAWIQSAGSCTVELDCSTTLGSGSDDEATRDLKEDFGGEDALGFFSDILEAQVEKLFGERATVVASTEFARPVHLGGEQVSVSASYSLPCNTKPISADSLTGQLMELVKEKVF